jgi:RHS repeat-associated protein
MTSIDSRKRPRHRHAVTYGYDNASRRATMTVVGQPQVVYTYDNANRLTQIQQGTSTVTIGYDDADRRTSVTYPNTNSVTYAYNAASELTSLTYKQGATTLGDLMYTYDAAGNRTKTGGTFARSNIPPALTTTSYNANNQQLTLGTTTETFDLNGNLATSTDAGVTTTYAWNARNQLTGISGPGLTASFTYDSFGRRTGKTINGTTTNFVYEGLNPVQEKSGATVTANLLTGLGIDEFFTRTDGVGVRALLPDALGSTVALGDGTGTLQTQYTYEPFGFTTQTGATNTNSYKYTGREDDGAGLYYYRARHYQPGLQRFIAEDPIEFLGGEVNLYAYVRNNPVLFKDPNGQVLITALVGGVIGAAGGAAGSLAQGGSLQQVLITAAIGGAIGLAAGSGLSPLAAALETRIGAGIAGAAGDLGGQLLCRKPGQGINWSSVIGSGLGASLGQYIGSIGRQLPGFPAAGEAGQAMIVALPGLGTGGLGLVGARIGIATGF